MRLSSATVLPDVVKLLLSNLFSANTKKDTYVYFTQIFSMGQISCGIGVGCFLWFGLLSWYLSICSLDNRSDSRLAFEEMYLAKTLTFTLRLCNTSIWMRVKQLGQEDIVLFTIATMLWLSQNKIIL